MIKASTAVSCLRRLRARPLGRYPSSFAAALTRLASSGSTVDLPFNARETVAVDTPARAATSLIVANCLTPCCALSPRTPY
ncbi:hypothetical protein GCM10010452_62620 [Crossiella cryophila]